LERTKAGAAESSNSGCKLRHLCAISLTEQPKLDPGVDGLFSMGQLQSEQLDAFAPTLAHRPHMSATPISMAQDALSLG
jgi:hypothetical protein